MSNQKTYGCPVLLQALKSEYGSELPNETITIQKSNELSEFMEKRQQWERNTSNVKIVFK